MAETAGTRIEGNFPPEGQRPRFDSDAASDVGKVRDHNEDCVLVNEGGVIQSRGIDGIYVVADGMGGHGAGEVASAIAVDVVNQQVGKRKFPRGINQFSQLTLDEQQKWLSGVVNQANHAVFERRKRSTDNAEKDMGTTLVVAVRSGNQVAVANVGDSRLYIISGDGKTIQRITRDHSLVERLVETRQITAEEAKVHPQRNMIYRTIGDKPQVEAGVFFDMIPRGGAMLLCSDGLSGMVENEQIRQIVVSSGSAQEATRRLIEAANVAGGEDNISAIVVKNETAAEKERKSPETRFSENARRVRELRDKGGKEMNLTRQELMELTNLFSETMAALAEMFEKGISLEMGGKSFTAMELFRMVNADRVGFEKKLFGS